MTTSLLQAKQTIQLIYESMLKWLRLNPSDTPEIYQRDRRSDKNEIGDKKGLGRINCRDDEECLDMKNGRIHYYGDTKK